MLNFNAAVNLYKNDKIQDLAKTDDGMRFLKLRSLSRKKYLDYLIHKFELKVEKGQILNFGTCNQLSVRSRSRHWLSVRFPLGR